ncbi:hypothetical protein Q1695_002784 [Nippostrongylus brasiliensis]|nr:hypothetical protein Q1695_002784 [Nippostrongylus brasiliensis]
MFSIADKRCFGTFFRVGFHGSRFGDLDGEEFVYKVSSTRYHSILKNELSPGLKFMRGCIFFSLEVIYADVTYTFNSTPESCYGIFSISYLVIYVVGVLAVSVTIYCIYVNYTAGEDADVIEEQSAEKKSRKSPHRVPVVLDVAHRIAISGITCGGKSGT